MRDKKISVLLVVSFLLLLASFLILCIWGYNFYRQVKEDAVLVKSEEITPQKQVTRDSLLSIYTSSIQSLENQLGSTWTNTDSLEGNLRLRLDEYYRLKDELALLLKSPRSDEDFKVARQKITELQKRIEALRITNTDISEENRRLYKLLSEMNERNSSSQQIRYVEPETRQVKNELPAAKPFRSSDLSMAAIKDESEDGPGNRITGTFSVQNGMDIPDGEIMVVVIQPDGKVLQKSAWESGSFQSKDGKKIYSCKMRFEYNRGEQKQVAFTLPAEKIERGTYILQLYHNGELIGKLSKVLG